MVWYGNRSTGPTSTTLEDFEGTDPLSNYAGDTGTYEVQQSVVLEGSNTLGTTAAFGQIGHTGGSTSRGNRYEWLFRTDTGSGTDTGLGLIVMVQDAANAYDDCYSVFLQDSQEMFVQARVGGSTDVSVGNDTFTISDGQAYRAQLDVAPTGESNNVTARVLETDGTVLGEESITHDTHTGGTWGGYGGNNVPSYWDALTVTPL